MATGYTYPVYEGEITQLRDWAKFLAPQMFYDNMVLVPDLKSEKKRLKEANEDLKQAKAMTLAQAESRIAESNVQASKENDKSIDNHAQIRARYEKMLAQVNAWLPPESLEGMKKMMLSQLEDSIKHDCSPYIREPTRISPQEFIKKEIEFAERSVGYATDHLNNATLRRGKVLAFIADMKKEFNVDVPYSEC